MATYEYKIGNNHNTADGSLVYFETIFNPVLYGFPNVNRIPDGALVRHAMDGTRSIDGERLVVVRYAKLSFTLLSSYITTYIGGWSSQDNEVTLKTRNPDGTFTRYNAIAYKPRVGEDYVHRTTDIVVNVTLTFRIVEASS